MKRADIFKAAACLFCAALLLSGCRGNENLKDMSVIEGIGIDGGNGIITVTVQSLDLSKQGNSAENLSGNMTMLKSGEGSDISSAVQRVSHSLSKKLFFGQSQLLVIGAELAENSLSSCFDYLLHSPDSRPDVAVCLSQGSAADVLAAAPAGALVPAQAAADLLLSGQQQGFSAYQTVNDMLDRYYNKTSDIYLPVIAANKDSLEISGIAIYNGDRQAAVIAPEQILGFLLLIDEPYEAHFDFSHPQYGAVSCALSSVKTKTRASVEGGEVVYSVSVSADLRVTETENGGAAGETDETLLQAAARHIENMCAAAFEKCVESSSDCIGVGKRLAADSPRDYAALSQSWKSAFSSARLVCTCDLKPLAA